MPRTTVVFFKNMDGSVPVKLWLDEFVAKRNRKALIKCRGRLNYLAAQGRDARRPYADYLRDGIYELRAECGNVNYRLPYFFSGNAAVVIAHGLTKENKVPDKDIDLAIARKKAFESNPEGHSYYEEAENF